MRQKQLHSPTPTLIFLHFPPQHELLYHTFGRQNFRRTTANLDLFLHRFNQVQLWVVTEVCLCSQLSKRVQLLKKFIKIAAQWVAHTHTPSAFTHQGALGRTRFISWWAWSDCVFAHSCREFKNLNSFFAIIMGMSNPAVSRLSQTWEVKSAKIYTLRGDSTASEKLHWHLSVYSPAEAPHQV